MVLPLVFLPAVAANFQTSRVERSFRILGNVHRIFPDSGVSDPGANQLPESSISHAHAHGAAHPGHLDAKDKSTHFPLLAAMASVSLISFVLLAFARYFFIYDGNDHYMC